MSDSKPTKKRFHFPFPEFTAKQWSIIITLGFATIFIPLFISITKEFFHIREVSVENSEEAQLMLDLQLIIAFNDSIVNNYRDDFSLYKQDIITNTDEINRKKHKINELMHRLRITQSDIQEVETLITGIQVEIEQFEKATEWGINNAINQVKLTGNEGNTSSKESVGSHEENIKIKQRKLDSLLSLKCK